MAKATTFQALQKLPHWRHDGRKRSEDADGAISAAIWGGAFSALHACVESVGKVIFQAFGRFLIGLQSINSYFVDPLRDFSYRIGLEYRHGTFPTASLVDVNRPFF